MSLRQWCCGRFSNIILSFTAQQRALQGRQDNGSSPSDIKWVNIHLKILFLIVLFSPIQKKALLIQQ